MNKYLVATLGLVPLPAFTDVYAAAPKEDTRPNIIFFLVDDMGWQDTSLPFWTAIMFAIVP